MKMVGGFKKYTRRISIQDILKPTANWSPYIFTLDQKVIKVVGK